MRRSVEGDPGCGGVFVQCAEGGDAGAGRGDGDALVFQDRRDPGGGEADGGLIDAEEGADEAAGHGQALPVDGGQDVAVEAEPGRTGRAGDAAPAAAAGQVQPLLAGSTRTGR